MRLVDGVWAAARSILPIGIPLVATALLVSDSAVTLRTVSVVALCFVVVTTAQVGMAFARPASLEIRKKPAVAAHGQPLADTIGLVVFLAYLIGWFAFLPADAARLHLLPPLPPWAQVLGLMSVLLGCALGQLALWQNAFASPAVQAHTGQTVVSTGAYGVVRHPLYTGNLLLFAGLALWIGSLAGLLGVAVILVATIGRILVEERHLRTELPGYAAYTQTVRARLIPYVL
jgi:protein-S-isoprenylcysteine O-methyltransferase Ste14